jgi:hypothetical protein
VDEWASIIKRDLGDAIDSIICAGTHLTQAKHQLGKGHYGDMLKAIGLHERTARRLIAIAENKVLTNPEYHARLPVSMRTLAELAEIPAPDLVGYIKDGTVNIDMERSEVGPLRKRTTRTTPTTPKTTPAERDRMALAAALEEIEQLKKLKADERFTPTDTAQNVAVALVGMFTPDKVRDICRRAEALLKQRGKPKPGKGPTRKLKWVGHEYALTRPNEGYVNWKNETGPGSVVGHGKLDAKSVKEQRLIGEAATFDEVKALVERDHAGE